MREWIEFHRIVGVDHFFLYNNNSVDQYKKVLEPYIKKGVVTLIDWPRTYSTREEWHFVQGGAYSNCVEKVINKYKWIAFIDVDEFLFPTRCYSLPVLLEKYRAYGGIKVNWVLFGTSGVKSLKSKKLMISQLRWRAPLTIKRNRFVKTIARPECLDTSCKWRGGHAPCFKEGYYAVSENYRLIDSNKSLRHSSNLIRINHYWMRSRDYFLKRKRYAPNRLGTTQDKTLVDYAIYDREKDTLILKYEKTLKKILGK